MVELQAQPDTLTLLIFFTVFSSTSCFVILLFLTSYLSFPFLCAVNFFSFVYLFLLCCLCYITHIQLPVLSHLMLEKCLSAFCFWTCETCELVECQQMKENNFPCFLHLSHNTGVMTSDSIKRWTTWQLPESDAQAQASLSFLPLQVLHTMMDV